MDSIHFIQQSKPGIFKVTGEFTFSNITQDTVKSLPLDKTLEHLVIDLTDITKADSAGLALMIEWIKQSQQNQIKICFQNIPDQLLALAKLSGFNNNPYFIGESC